MKTGDIIEVKLGGGPGEMRRQGTTRHEDRNGGGNEIQKIAEEN